MKQYPPAYTFAGIKRYLLATLLLALNACSQSMQQPFALDQRVQVMLPSQPQLVAMQSLPEPAYTSRAKMWQLFNNTGTYQLTRIVNPALHFTAHDTLGRAAYYAKYVAALKEEKAHGISALPFTVGGVEGKEFRYDSEEGTSYMRCLVLDSVQYTFVFLPDERLGALEFMTAAQRRSFFNSLTIKP